MGTTLSHSIIYETADARTIGRECHRRLLDAGAGVLGEVEDVDLAV